MNIEKVLLIGIQESYNNLVNTETIDEEKLYFCTDTRNLYKGYDLYTDAIRYVVKRPSDLKDIAVGKLYYISSKKTIEYYDGKLKEWVSLIPRIVEGIEVEEDDDGVEFISDECQHNIPTSMAVFSLIQTQLDKFANSGRVVTDLYGDNEAVIRMFRGSNLLNRVQLKGLLMRPVRKKFVNEIELALDENWDIISKVEKDENNNDITKYKTIRGDYIAGEVKECRVYPVTGEPEYPVFGDDIHVDPDNPGNGFNVDKNRYEFYLNDGTRVILPVNGTVGDLESGNFKIPNYTKYVTIEGSETDTAIVNTNNSGQEINIATNVKLSEHPNNSLVIDYYDPISSIFEGIDESEYMNQLVWVDKSGVVHWINTLTGKYYFKGSDGVSTSDYASGNKWTDRNGITYTIKNEENELRATWTASIILNSEGSDENEEYEEPDDDSDDSSGGDDNNDSESDDDSIGDDDDYTISGDPVSYDHWMHASNGKVYHCYKLSSGETETDSIGRKLLYYFHEPRTTLDDEESFPIVYKHFWKQDPVSITNPDGTPGTAYQDNISDVVVDSEQLNIDLLDFFSVNRFSLESSGNEGIDEDDPNFYRGGLMVDLTPYTLLTTFWTEVNRLDARIDELDVRVNKRIDDLNKKVDDNIRRIDKNIDDLIRKHNKEIKELHDLIKIETF